MKLWIDSAWDCLVVAQTDRKQTTSASNKWIPKQRRGPIEEEQNEDEEEKKNPGK